MERVAYRRALLLAPRLIWQSAGSTFGSLRGLELGAAEIATAAIFLLQYPAYWDLDGVSCGSAGRRLAGTRGAAWLLPSRDAGSARRWPSGPRAASATEAPAQARPRALSAIGFKSHDVGFAHWWPPGPCAQREARQGLCPLAASGPVLGSIVMGRLCSAGRATRAPPAGGPRARTEGETRDTGSGRWWPPGPRFGCSRDTGSARWRPMAHAMMLDSLRGL